MTLQDIRDDFFLKYKIECNKRSSKEIQFGDRALAKLISDAQQDIQRRHNILQGTYTLIMNADVYTYELPSECSNIIQVSTDSVFLEKKNINEIRDYEVSNGVPTQYAMILNDVPSIQFNLSTAGQEIEIYYDIDTNYFSTTDSDWGTFATKFSGGLRLPQRYNNAVVLYLLSQLFDDMLPKYEKELMSLRESQYRNRTTTKYRMGGY